MGSPTTAWADVAPARPPAGNFFFAGARLFFRSLEAAIFLFARVARIPEGSLVLPAICTEERITLGAELASGAVIRGQNEISHPAAPGQRRATLPYPTPYPDTQNSKSIPKASLVLPAICTEERITLGIELASGTVIRGQNEISHPAAPGQRRATLPYPTPYPDTQNSNLSPRPRSCCRPSAPRSASPSASSLPPAPSSAARTRSATRPRQGQWRAPNPPGCRLPGYGTAKIEVLMEAHSSLHAPPCRRLEAVMRSLEQAHACG